MEGFPLSYNIVTIGNLLLSNLLQVLFTITTLACLLVYFSMWFSWMIIACEVFISCILYRVQVMIVFLFCFSFICYRNQCCKNWFTLVFLWHLFFYFGWHLTYRDAYWVLHHEFYTVQFLLPLPFWFIIMSVSLIEFNLQSSVHVIVEKFVWWPLLVLLLLLGH